MAEMMGMPPPTAASNAIERPSSRALSKSSRPCSANSALFAVTMSLPLSSSFNTMVRAGSNPPTSSTATETSGSLRMAPRSSVNNPGGRAKLRLRRVSVSTTYANSTGRPACRATRDCCSRSNRATPEPMVPKPTIATLADFIMVIVLRDTTMCQQQALYTFSGGCKILLHFRPAA